MSWYERWVLSFLSAALSIIEFNVKDPAFLKKYKTALQSIVKTADIIKPYLKEE